MLRFAFIILLHCILFFQIRFCFAQDNESSKACGCICNSAVQVGVVEDNIVEDRSSEVKADIKKSESEKQPLNDNKTSEIEKPSPTKQGPVYTPSSCIEATAATSKSGVYKIQIPQLNLSSVDVYCDEDTDGGGWLVVQRRVSNAVDFYKSWNYYKMGFGDINESYWIGLEKLYTLTSSCEQEIGIILRKRNEKYTSYYAKYSKFLIGSESEEFVLKELGTYSGTAGDSLTFHLGMKFSTAYRDNDLDPKNCALYYRSGWWFKNCYLSNLNGDFLAIDKYGINWHTIGDLLPLQFSQMMIRPTQNCWRILVKNSITRGV
nr:fibrinogen-like protein A [Bactrocera oleae]